MRRRMSAVAALAFALCLALSGCASGPGTRAKDRPLRIGYRDLRSSQRFELVNESHTDRVEQYSQVRAEAGRKVGTDEIVSALVDFLRQHDFDDLAHPGAAPATADPSWLWTLEVEDAGASSYIAMPRGLSQAERARYQPLWAAFLDTYNATYGLQAVEVEQGRELFRADGHKRGER